MRVPSLDQYNRNHHLQHILSASEDVWYVSNNNGNDNNNGKSPDTAFATIGAATTAMSDGDKIIVGEGTYDEAVVIDHVGIRFICEPGVVIQGNGGTCLTVSGARSIVECPNSSLLCDPDADQTGVVASGNFVYLNDIRVSGESSAVGNTNDLGFDITGNGCILNNCRCASPDVAAFKIQGDKCKLERCCTGGNSGYTSIGFWFTNSCDKFRVFQCGSQGHDTAGFQIDSGCTNGVVEASYSGGGDGRWINNGGSSCIFTDFNYDGAVGAYDSPIRKVTTFAGADTTYNIFKVTGSVRVINLYGIVDTVIPNTSSTIHLSLYSTGGEVDITKEVGGPDIDQAPVGSIIKRVGDSTDALEYESSATPAIIEFSDKNPDVAIDLVADADQTTYVRLNLSAALASGAIQWRCRYLPLSNLGFIEPA